MTTDTPTCSDCGAPVTDSATRYTHADGKPRIACERCEEELRKPHRWPHDGDGVVG